MEGLAKSESIEDFGADRVLGHVGSPTDVGDEENSQGWLFSGASHCERSELGEISTLGTLLTPKLFSMRQAPSALYCVSLWDLAG
jgi:hypothetical protein